MSSYYIISVTPLQGIIKNETSIGNKMEMQTNIGDTLECSRFQKDLGYLLTNSDTKIPFIHLCHELDKHGFVHTGVVEDGPENNPMGYCVRILKIPGRIN